MTNLKRVNTLLISTVALALSVGATADSIDFGYGGKAQSIKVGMEVTCQILWNADGSGSKPAAVAEETPGLNADGSTDTVITWSADGSGSRQIRATVRECNAMHGKVVFN